jgi:hypothetical protein
MPVTAFAPKKKVLSGYDPVIASDQLKALLYIKNTWGIPVFCRRFFTILAKKEIWKQAHTRLVPFDMTKIQLDLTNTAGPNNITVKGRQIGSTTWHILVRLMMPAILEPGSSGLLISQTKPYGAQHFRILQRALKNFARNGQQSSAGTIMTADMFLKNLLHTQYSARHEIVFDFLDSKVLVDTAENPDAGTGLTINHLVATEVAYWMRDPESLLSQAKEAVPAGGTKDYESTPNGMGGYFFEEWQRSKEPQAEFTSHFYPWWMHEEYEQDPAADPATMSAEEEKMAKEFAWTMKQLTWRRTKQKALRFKFGEKYPENDIECFLVSGSLFFDADALRWLKFETQRKKPIDSYHSGQLKIFKRRIKGRRYIIGADVAEGKLISTDNADASAAVVLDVDTGEQCAVYRSHLPPEDFAQDLVDMAIMYNNAQLAIERNGPGGSVILAVQKQLLYGNIYYHKEWYRERKMVIPMAGYPTNLRTRPIALNRVAAAIRTAPEFIHSEDFVNEALTFVWRASNKQKMGGKRVPQGAEGCHDDIVMAMAAGEYCRAVMLGGLDPVEIPSERYGQVDAEEDEQAA